MRVLAVCKGNTCRSPMFAAVLSRELAAAGRSDIIVESAGFSKAAEGQSAAAEWSTIQERTGIDLSAHRSRHIMGLDVEQYDKIICLDAEVHQSLLDLGWWAPRLILLDIPNPWQKGQSAYDECYETICKVARKYVY